MIVESHIGPGDLYINIGVFGPPKMDMAPVKRVKKVTDSSGNVTYEPVVEDNGKGGGSQNKTREQDSHPVRGLGGVGWKSNYPDPNDADRGKDD
jgi:hypothetical protein